MVWALAVWGLLPLLFCVLTAFPGYAAEEPEKFLGKLRERGYFDTASDYLDFIAESGLVDDAFKQSIPFEQAVTLKERAARSGDRVKQEKLLEEATKAFQDFAAARPNSARAADVHLEVANVYSLLAKITMAATKRPGADRKALEAKAAKYYADALTESIKAEKVIQEHRKKVRRELAAVRKATGNLNDPNRKLSKKERDLIELRDKLRNDWIKAEFTQVTLQNLMATVYEKGSAEWKQAVEKATKAYEEMFLKHDVRLVGLICRVQQMRCLAELGRFDEALECLPDVTAYEESESPPLRKVWFDSFVVELESLIGKGRLAEAVALSLKSRLTKPEQQSPQGQTILYLRAKAALALIEKLGADKKKEKEKLRAQAKKALEALVETSSAYQAEAREKLAALGIKAKEPEEEGGDPDTFDGAFRRAVAAMQQWGQISGQVSQAEGGAKQKLEKQLAEQGAKAFDFYRQAISLAENDTKPAKLRGVQKGLCYLYLNQGDFLRAAVLGEYLLDNYPGSAEGTFGRSVATSAWLKMYGAAGADNEFEKEKVKRLAHDTIDSDALSSQAAAARSYLLTFAIQDSDVDEAWIHLKELPKSASRIHKSQILVGQMLWNRYSRNRRLSEDARPSLDALAADRDRGAESLAAGLKGYEDTSAVDYAIAQGAYVLAMLQLGENKPEEAIAVLEHPVYGPLTLIEAEHPAIADKGYDAKAYRLALRAYIGALPLYAEDQETQDAMVAKAFDVVNQLEKTVGTDGDAESRLTKIYVDLGKDLELQIEGLEESGNNAAKRALVDAFELFLEQIKKSPAPSVSGELAKLDVTEATASDAQKKEAAEKARKKAYSRLIWIAETYYTLGNSNRKSDAKVARNYYKQAARVYDDILVGQMYSLPRQRTTIRLRLADCYRGMREYDDALAEIAEVLGKKKGNLTAQLQAAETLYDAGESDCGSYVKSILGAEEDDETGKNIIWGWKRLAQQTSGNDAFAGYFFKAKLYGVRARRMYAECMDSGDEKKKRKLLSAAKGNLLQIHNQFPDFGGENFKAEFDSEMKQVQAALGEEQVGFPPEDEEVKEPIAVNTPAT